MVWIQKFPSARLILLAAICGVLQWNVGCTTEFDFSALHLDPSMVVDYGNEVKEQRIEPEILLYGQLSPGNIGEGQANSFSQELKELYSNIEKAQDLTNIHRFSDKENLNLQSWVQSVQDKIIAEFSGSISLATKNSSSAKKLALVLMPLVKSAGILETLVTDGERIMPEVARNDFKAITKKIVGNFERLFKLAIVMAQRLPQQEVSHSLKKIDDALSVLKDHLDHGNVISDPTAQDTAGSALLQAISSARTGQTHADKMISRSVVGSDLQGVATELISALSRVKTDMVDKVNENFMAEAKSLHTEATVSAHGLVSLARNYGNPEGTESLKSENDNTKINTLIDEAFDDQMSVMSGQTSVEKSTDINELVRTLKVHNVVLMSLDSNSLPLVRALASSVFHGVASALGLDEIDNVVGPDHEKINMAKGAFEMSDREFGIFVKSRVEMIGKSTSIGGKYKNIYIVFDQFAEGANIDSVVSGLKPYGKVIVMTAQPKRIRGHRFSPRGLNVSEGILSANAIIKKERPELNDPEAISDSLSRLAVGLGQLELSNMGMLVRDTLARLGRKKQPTSDDIASSVMNALSAQNFPIWLAKGTGLLTDSLPVLEANIEKNRYHYIEQGRLRNVGKN